MITRLQYNIRNFLIHSKLEEININSSGIAKFTGTHVYFFEGFPNPNRKVSFEDLNTIEYNLSHFVFKEYIENFKSN